MLEVSVNRIDADDGGELRGISLYEVAYSPTGG